MGKSSSQLSRRRREVENNDGGDNSDQPKRNKATMEADGGGDAAEEQRRVPLSDVVSDCVERWFQDTLKEAKSGDISMQVLVGQMYRSGYGVPRDVDKGKFWITRASRVRSSVWKVSNKRPGYNASDSDSDSDDLAGDS